jgi:LacI family transcriptional regulator
MRKLQLDDLSKELGYSKTLISMVLNGKGNQYGISKKTQALVLDTAARLNYTPNKFAKSLRTGKSYFIGLIVSDISNPFYSTIAKRVESLLFESGYNLMVCSTDENEEREKLLVDMMVNQQGVDGLIISSVLQNAEFYEHARFSKTPMVFIDRVVPLHKANYVLIDNYGGALSLVNQLIKQNCKKIACFAITPLHLSTIEDRLNGYRKAIQNAGIQVDPALIRSIRFMSMTEDVEQELRAFMETKTIPDAIFVLNNHLAVVLLKLIKTKQYSVFENVKIACFDDIELFNIIDKPVTSLAQPMDAIGKVAVDKLMATLAGNQLTTSSEVLPTQLIER